MTKYLDIVPAQEPFLLPADDLGRAVFAFNIDATKQASETFPEEVLKLLQNAGVGTPVTNMFIGSQATLPLGDGPYLNLIETPGQTALRTHNSVATPAYQRPSAQITVRAKTLVAARAMARAAYNALVGVRNQEVTL